MRALMFLAAVSAMLCAAAPAFAQQDDPAFARCAACHSLTKGKNGVGPSLFGIVGAKVAAAPGYAYSNALKSKGGTWTAAALDGYLADPSVAAPGTKMPMGVKDAAKRAEVIAFLKKIR